jgi:hypothetical protein
MHAAGTGAPICGIMGASLPGAAMPSLQHHLRRLVAACALGLAGLGAAAAADLSSGDAQTVRQVVQEQLRAFAANDAQRAFALADPGIRSKFENADQFMAMVRSQYPMVHRPATVLFLKAEADGATVFQRVRLTDAGGTGWLATYLLHRQKDHQWRISACVVVPDGPRLST